jgi:hypothetical protein
MESLFSPCTRYRDMLESRGRLKRFNSHTEILKELNLDVSTEELLSAERALTYVDLYAMSGNQNKVLWLTPHAAIARQSERVIRFWLQLDEALHFSFSADGKDMYALARSPEHLLEICDVVLRLLAASLVHSLILLSRTVRDGDRALINTPTLASLMKQCPSLKLLSLENVEMDENHCRVLGDYSRPDLEIILIRCKLTSAGASALAKILRRNQGPTELKACFIDYSVIVDGLHGNSRLKSLTPINSGSPEDVNREVLAIAGTLKENKSLVVFDLSYYLLSEQMWDAVCDSLKTHPTLQFLSLRQYHSTLAGIRPLGVGPWTLAVLKSQIQALVDMLKVNMSIHTIRLPNCYYLEHELLQGPIIPYLETNRLRPRVRAIQKTHPIEYRAKVLGRALLAVHTDANSLWMLLSGNAEVAFPSRTTTGAVITPATNLPTPATTVVTSYAATAITFFGRCLCCY